MDNRWASRIGFNIWSGSVYWCAAMVYWCAALVPRKWWCQPWTRNLKYDWRIFDVKPVRPKRLVNHPQESLGESATWVSFLESRTFEVSQGRPNRNNIGFWCWIFELFRQHSKISWFQVVKGVNEVRVGLPRLQVERIDCFAAAARKKQYLYVYI